MFLVMDLYLLYMIVQMMWLKAMDFLLLQATMC